MSSFEKEMAERITGGATGEARALPLIGQWVVTGSDDNSAWGPANRTGLPRAGHYQIPSFDFPLPGTYAGATFDAYFKTALEEASRLNLPISFISTQWEGALRDSAGGYNTAPAATNPCVVSTTGAIVGSQLSPFGYLDAWSARGQEVMDPNHWSAAAVHYPNPPKVIFASNNEASKIRWDDIENDQRYLDLYGAGQTDEFKRDVVREGWKTRYTSMFNAMRNALPAAWQSAACFIGYKSFGTQHFGRPATVELANWRDESFDTSASFDIHHEFWDGAGLEYYDYHSTGIGDFKGRSMQVECMNQVFMIDDARAANPDFWVELMPWDGHPSSGAVASQRSDYRSAGQIFTPERYVGDIKFGMWTIKPQVVREYRLSGASFAENSDYYDSLSYAVTRIRNNSTLRSFWQNGSLVSHQTQDHFYQTNLPSAFSSETRWFMLDATPNPGYDWSFGSVIPVFSLANVKGDTPSREWLVYAHAPTGAQASVGITIPSAGGVFATFTADIAVAGNYYHVIESAGTISSISEIT